MSDETQDVELARLVDVAASGVDGVARLYSAAPGVVRTAKQLTSTESALLPLSAVSSSDGELSVTVCIEVSQASAEVARSVADAVRTALAPRAPRVHVRVSRVSTSG